IPPAQTVRMIRASSGPSSRSARSRAWDWSRVVAMGTSPSIYYRIIVQVGSFYYTLIVVWAGGDGGTTMLRKVLMDAFGVPVGCWGRLGGPIMGVSNRDINELTVALLEAGPRDRVLEIGYGPGTALALLGEQTGEGWVAGVDPSAEMARQARRRNCLLIRRGRVGLAIGTSAR